jgi:hypothetical protein
VAIKGRLTSQPGDPSVEEAGRRIRENLVAPHRMKYEVVPDDVRAGAESVSDWYHAIAVR